MRDSKISLLNKLSQIETNQEIEEEEDEEKIQQYSELLDNDIDKLNSEQNLQTIIFNCLGVLTSLLYQGDINLQENNFIKNLSEDIEKEHKEELYIIHDAIQNITTKLDM